MCEDEKRNSPSGKVDGFPYFLNRSHKFINISHKFDRNVSTTQLSGMLMSFLNYLIAFH